MDEVLHVITDMRRRAFYIIKPVPRHKSHVLNLAIFRLSCCCGLRRTEMSLLRLRDVILAGPRPCIRVRAETTKGRRAVVDGNGTTISKDKRRARLVPLWWDLGTLEDLRAWTEYRKTLPGTDGGPCGPDSRFLAGTDQRSIGGQVSARHIAARWKTALRCLGPERRRQLSVHCGRRTFASLSLAGGRGLVEVKEALGHTNISTTSLYLGLVERDNVPDIFRGKDPVVISIADQGG